MSKCANTQISSPQLPSNHSLPLLQRDSTDKTPPLLPKPSPRTTLMRHMAAFLQHNSLILLLELHQADRALCDSYPEE